VNGGSRRGEVVFVLRLDFGLEFIFMRLAGILNEVVLRLEIGRCVEGLRFVARSMARSAKPTAARKALFAK
jgi:hypothetical protein